MSTELCCSKQSWIRWSSEKQVHKLSCIQWMRIRKVIKYDEWQCTSPQPLFPIIWKPELKASIPFAPPISLPIEITCWICQEHWRMVPPWLLKQIPINIFEYLFLSWGLHHYLHASLPTLIHLLKYFHMYCTNKCGCHGWFPRFCLVGFFKAQFCSMTQRQIVALGWIPVHKEPNLMG